MKHRLKPGGLHTGSENWNRQWDKFFESNPYANSTEIINQLDKMKFHFGLK